MLEENATNKKRPSRFEPAATSVVGFFHPELPQIDQKAAMDSGMIDYYTVSTL